jgi:hypothetical protein
MLSGLLTGLARLFVEKVFECTPTDTLMSDQLERNFTVDSARIAKMDAAQSAH